MRDARLLSWFVFTVWAVWCFALSSWIGGSSAFARWVPEVGLVFGLCLLVHLEPRDVPWWSLSIAWARSAVSVEPGIVTLAGFMGVALFAFGARSVVELTHPGWRALTCGIAVLACDAWFIVAHQVRGAEHLVAGAPSLLSAWPTALTSAALALVLGSTLAHLPGLTPLRSRKW